MNSKKTVLVAMSGGVDSAVALLKVIDMGYNAIGVSMKLWEYKQVGGNVMKDTNCCAIESINNAKLVCERLGVPHYTIDFTNDFKEKVIDNFVDEYLAGRTPNPCVRCNSYVKCDTFIEQADKLVKPGKFLSIIDFDPITSFENNYIHPNEQILLML